MLERVTQQSQISNTLSYFRTQTVNLSRLQTEIATGVKLDRASENPGDFALLQAGKTKDLRYDAYKQTVSDATAQLNTSVSSLTDLNTGLTRARTLAQQGIDATTDPSGYEALAEEVDSILNRTLTDANATADGKALFAGTATNVTPFVVASRNSRGEIASVTYQGSDQRGQGLIGPDQTVDTQYAGNRVFQSGNANVFQSLIDLRDALRDTTQTSAARGQTLTAKLQQVENASTAVLTTVGEQSADLSNLEAVSNRISDLQLEVKSRNSDLESTDIASAVVQFQQAENVFQSSLSVASKLFNNNLLDFIK